MKWLQAAILLCCLLGAARAVAQPAPDSAEALFDGGAKAYQEARYDDAVELFLAAYQKDPQPELLYNVAQAYERLGDVRNALRAYRDFLRAVPAFDERAMIDTRVRNLEKRLREQGVQQVSVLSTPAGAAVELDGKDVGRTPWTGDAPPGRHTVLLRLPGYVEARKELMLAGDRAIDLDVALVAASTSPEPTKERRALPATVSPEADQGGDSPTIRPWTWATLGVGAAALTSSVVFELLRASAESDAEDATTQLEYRKRYDEMKSRQTTARVLLGIGAIASIAGGVLLYVDLSRTKDTTRLGVGCLHDGCGVFGVGRF